MKIITSLIEKDPETGKFVAVVPSLPGAHTEAETIEDLLKNLKEVIELCLQELNPEEIKLLPEFVGLQQLEIDI